MPVAVQDVHALSGSSWCRTALGEVAPCRQGPPSSACMRALFAPEGAEPGGLSMVRLHTGVHRPEQAVWGQGRVLEERDCVHHHGPWSAGQLPPAAGPQAGRVTHTTTCAVMRPGGRCCRDQRMFSKHRDFFQQRLVSDVSKEEQKQSLLLLEVEWAAGEIRFRRPAVALHTVIGAVTLRTVALGLSHDLLALGLRKGTHTVYPTPTSPLFLNHHHSQPGGLLNPEGATSRRHHQGRCRSSLARWSRKECTAEVSMRERRSSGGAHSSGRGVQTSIH